MTRPRKRTAKRSAKLSPKPWMAHMTEEHRRDLTTLRRRAAKARRFPYNTDPSSRHLHIMADSLIKYGVYHMVNEEPVHCAESILAVITALWELRTEADASRRLAKGGRK